MSKRIVFKARDLPIHQNMIYPTVEEAIACPRGDVSLVYDDITGLIYNTDFDPEVMAYNKNYQNEQAFSLVFQEHLNQVASIIGKRFSQMNIVEIGCGKAWFLELLRGKGFDVKGVDPAYEGEKDYIIKDYFSSDLNLKTDALILRHTLEHIQNPIEFLKSIAEANNHSGLIYIEVPCFEWIQENKVWFDIFYEHVNYFRLADFKKIFGNIIDAGHIFNGQYLYIIGDLSSLKTTKKSNVDMIDMPDDFMGSITKAERIFKKGKNKKNIVWGGSSKGVIFCHYLSQRGCRPDMIVDINPAKQGMYAPATGVKIEAPDVALKEMNEGDNIFIMNSNYVKEIKNITDDQFTYIQVDRL